ncbi:MAG: adenylate/guanylate cyclase domain-containing protein, partial [Bacillota bacterium]|nr:adenylate/guanylate cyclase domain-containing protein [Bacillota bacterium]
MRRVNFRQYRAIALIHVALFLLTAILIWNRSLYSFDNTVRDAWYQQSSEPSIDIVVIAIDDASLNALGQWPWPRDYHAELIERLDSAGVRAIGIDVLFPEESDREADDALVEAVASSGKVVLAGYGTFPSVQKFGAFRATTFTAPFERLRSVAEIGHINSSIDPDGLVRQALLSIELPARDNRDPLEAPYDAAASPPGERLESFPYRLYAKLSDAPKPLAAIRQDASGRTPIRYIGPAGTFEQISYVDVLTGEVDPEYFRGKAVLIGPTGVGIADDYVYTPIDPNYPMYGVEVQANIVQQLLYERSWTEVAYPVEITILSAFAATASYLFLRLRPAFAALAGIALTALHFGIWRVLSVGTEGWITDLIYLPLLLLTQYIATTVYRYLAEHKERGRVTQVFGQYVAPQIVETILKQGEEALKLGGSRRDITVLFVDIRGFTPLSEAAQPEDVVDIVNAYLTLCAEAIFEYGGTLDKYIGDAAMALYNAPLDLENHTLRAIQTAWRMKEGSEALARSLRERFGKEVQFGIGIHCGPAIVGNIGASFRLDYTAIGDTVNTAARLESNAKAGQILISQAVYDRVR